MEDEVKTPVVPEATDAAQRAFEQNQKEREALGIEPLPEEPKAQTVQEETPEVPKVEPKVEPEKPVEPKPVSHEEYRDYKKQLRDELQKDFDAKLEKLKAEGIKVAPDAAKSDDLEADLDTLAKELDFPKENLAKIINVARKGLALSEDDKNVIQNYREKQAEIESNQRFDSEWSELPIKDQFPNASAEQIEKAQEKMDEFVQSEKYVDAEMDYILFKEKAAFDQILFSPKQKTFEAGRPSTEVNADEDFPEFNPNMTPAQFEQFEKKRAKALENSPRSKVQIRTRDDLGRVVERWE